MNLQEPVFTREYDAHTEVWYARVAVESAQVKDTDLESLADDFGQGFTRYYSLKVLSEAKQAGGKVCLVFKGQDDDPCAILPYRPEPSMLAAFMERHGPNLDRLVGRVLAEMNSPNP